MPEHTFEPIRLSEDEAHALRERMERKADCRAMASGMIKRRQMPGPTELKRLRTTYGIDATRSLTEIERHDAGDAHLVADEPEVHALRYVPVGMWTPADILLMATYQQGPDTTLWLALDHLSRDPLMAADGIETDLLLCVARRLCETEILPTPHGKTAFAALSAAHRHANSLIWARFDQICTARALDGRSVEENRVGVLSGHALPQGSFFRNIRTILNRLAQIGALMTPARPIFRATGTIFYGFYRPKCGLEVIPAAEFRDNRTKEILDRGDTFYFRRETRFDITPDDEGVRLRHFAESAVENWLGLAYSSPLEAMDKAVDLFDLTQNDWHRA